MSSEEKKETIADLLHQLSEKSGGISFQDILKEAKKAALKGKTFIKIKCSEADYDCIYWESLFEQTPLVQELKNNGFILKADYDLSFWSYKRNYYLTILW